MQSAAMWLIASVLCAGAACGPCAAFGAEPGGDEIVRPCVEGSPEYGDARRQLDSVDSQIRALRPETDHHAANAALIALMGHQCMALAFLRVEPFRADAPAVMDALRAEAAPALIDFWTKSGRFWAESALGLAKQRRLVLPTSMRKVVSSETRADDLSLSQPCPLADARCGLETRGWSARAEAFFNDKAKKEPFWTSDWTGERSADIRGIEGCTDLVRSLPEPARYEEWSRCVGSLTPRRFVMSLGGIRLPSSGWLVVRVQHGVYAFCDPVRVYSLKTGAAYVTEDCPQLGYKDVLPERDLILRPGSISTDNAREAAWMLQQLTQIKMEYADDPGYIDLPAGIEPAKVRNRQSADRNLTMICSTGRGARLAKWAIVSESGETLASASLYTGGCDNYAAIYGFDLLRVVEAGFVPGCAREVPPGTVTPRKSKPVSPLEVDRLPIRLEPSQVTEVFLAARAACAISGNAGEDSSR